MIHTDVVVIGAGPVGLFQVFQLGLLGIDAHVVDVLPEAGGQCIALYPDKPIYDVPGIPHCTGRELASLLLKQASPFLGIDTLNQDSPRLHLGHQVESVTPHAGTEPGFTLTTHQQLTFNCKAVMVAAGAGAFVPRTLNLPGLEGASNLHYHLDDDLLARLAGQHVVISGGGEEAVGAAIELASLDAAHKAARITLLHRRDQFQVDADLAERLNALIQAGDIEVTVGMPTDCHRADGVIHSLALLTPDSTTVDLPLDHLLVRQGMSPKLGPLANWGLPLERKQVPVSSATFESDVPRIFAVGDINTYPGKKRLLLCGFHEATLAAHAASTILRPDTPQHLLYTTTSPLLHERLGVKRSS